MIHSSGILGTLRVFNDDTLTPGAVWPLHPHCDNEVVTYCAEGEFRHADEHGGGGVLKKGWVRHTTVGGGMWHSEINNRPDQPMRFIQMWFYPSKYDLPPAVEQKAVEKVDRTDRFLPIVSNRDEGALHIVSDARVVSGFLHAGKTEYYDLENGRGIYLYAGKFWLFRNCLGFDFSLFSGLTYPPMQQIEKLRIPEIDKSLSSV